jgi:nitrile hydratase subunit beta
MNGVHDMGGMHGFGPVAAEPQEPVFHHAWERRAFAITVAAGFLGKWNIDMSRYARERMRPADYLAASYYERWSAGLERLLDEQGLVSRAEVEARVAALGRGEPPPPTSRTAPPPDVRVLPAAAVAKVLAKGGSTRVDADVPPRFRPGDAVVARNLHPTGHTRLPRYARGRRGVIDRDHGVFVFADTNAMGLGEKPQHCYSVRFGARELWGPEASPRHQVFIDLWDDHLDPT